MHARLVRDSLSIIQFYILQLIDGTALTIMRTAASSAAAIKVELSTLVCANALYPCHFFLTQALVTSPPSVLCIVGSGGEARSHVHALRVCYKFREIHIWGRTKSKAVK